MNKAVLLVLGSLFALFVLGIVAIGWWWSQNADSIKSSLKDTVKEGQALGARLDEAGCVTEVSKKLKGSGSFFEIAKGGGMLTFCLQTAKPSADFCQGVPPAQKIMDAANWVMESCPKPVGSDQICQSMMQQVASYCQSWMRTEKLKKFSEKAPTEKP